MVPFGDFNSEENGRPKGWTLSEPTGGTWLAADGRTGGAIRVTGNGQTDVRWLSGAVPVVGGAHYAVSFWQRGSGSGCVTSGFDDINVDWGFEGADWKPRLFVCRMQEGRKSSQFHLGQWHVAGQVDFDDVAVERVNPVYRTMGGLTLGHGEEVDGQAYAFTSRYGTDARNSARPLVSMTAAFNTDRVCINGKGQMTYRHALPERTWTNGLVSVSCGYYAHGAAIVEISRDGREWTRLGRIAGATTIETAIPAALLPAKELFVRVQGEESCNLQIYTYAFEGKFAGTPTTALGSTSFVSETTGKTVYQTHVSRFLEAGYGELLPGGNGDFALWRASSGWKIPRRRELPTATADRLVVKTAANEAEAVQLVLTPTKAVKDARVSVTALQTSAGPSIPATAVEVLRVGYVPIRQTTDGSGCRGLWPDPLPPQDGVCAVEAGINQPFWIRVKPPKGTPAGVYTGRVEMRIETVEGAVRTASVPLEVEVFGFELPDTMSCETSFGFSPWRIEQYHGLKTDEQKKSVVAKYLQSLADHHISPYNPTPYVTWDLKWKGFRAWTGGTPDPQENFDGRPAVRVVDESTTSNASLNYSDRVPLGNRGVKISFAYRTATDQSFFLSIGNHRTDGSWMYGRNHDVKVPASRAWRKYETVYSTMPQEAVEASLSIFPGEWRENGSTTGTVWLSGFEVKDVETGRTLLAADEFGRDVDPAHAEPVFSWTAWDRAMEAAFAQYHFNSFVIGISGLGGGTYESRVEPSIMGIPASNPAYDVLMGKYLRAIEAHLREKGWLDKAYVYWFDEPEPKDYEFVMNGFNTLKRHAPGLRRMLTEQVEEGLLGGPNLWVPLTPSLHVPLEGKARAAGDTIWWYVCCGPKAPYVTEFTDHPGTEMRLWLWQTWGENVTGILIWETLWWSSSNAYPDPAHPQNPYEDAMCWVQSATLKPGAKSPWGNGDGRFLYPPLKAAQPAQSPVLDGPVDSFRLEMLRDGLEDYEYFAELKRRLAKRQDLTAAQRAEYESLLKVPSAVYTSLTSFTTDPAPMEAHREKLARAIMCLGR